MDTIKNELQMNSFDRVLDKLCLTPIGLACSGG